MNLMMYDDKPKGMVRLTRLRLHSADECKPMQLSTCTPCTPCTPGMPCNPCNPCTPCRVHLRLCCLQVQGQALDFIRCQRGPRSERPPSSKERASPLALPSLGSHGGGARGRQLPSVPEEGPPQGSTCSQNHKRWHLFHLGCRALLHG